MGPEEHSAPLSFLTPCGVLLGACTPVATTRQTKVPENRGHTLPRAASLCEQVPGTEQVPEKYLLSNNYYYNFKRSCPFLSI